MSPWLLTLWITVQIELVWRGNLGHTIGTMSDDQFTQLDQKIDKLGEQILKLYQHMEQRFDHLENTKADKTTVDRILQTVDGIATRLEADDHERLAMASQLGRHEGWFKQLSKATKTKLVPEP